MVQLEVYENGKCIDIYTKEKTFRDSIFVLCLGFESNDVYCIKTISPGYNNYHIAAIDEDDIDIANASYKELVEFINNYEDSVYKFKIKDDEN